MSLKVLLNKSSYEEDVPTINAFYLRHTCKPTPQEAQTREHEFQSAWATQKDFA